MKKLLILLLVLIIAVIFFGYHYFFKKEVITIVQMDQYGPKLRSLHDNIFSFRDTRSPNPTAEIQRLRGSTQSRYYQNDSGSDEARTVLALCDILSDANAKREKCEARLRDVRAKPYDSLKRGSAAKKRDAEKTRKFFEAAVFREWNDYVRLVRLRSERLLTKLH